MSVNNRSEIFRVKIEIHGAVQGVGFRPFVFNLAKDMGLAGCVNNTSEGVVVEAEGKSESLNNFLEKIQEEKPKAARIYSFKYLFLEPKGYKDFSILKSDAAKAKSAAILPDIATCPECLNEIFNKNDRRYLYPFTNCTHCGPRYSIINDIPYDRSNTSMKVFKMCDACQAEYDDPKNRRFHAQPNACPKCGPHIELLDNYKNCLGKDKAAIDKLVEAINNGQVAAVKGLGGFHLCVDAANDEAVKKLRERKHREEKPLALMVPDIKDAEKLCSVNRIEKTILMSNEAPIVLLKKKQDCEEIISKDIAPDNPYLGLMLPYTPLHHILMKELGRPIVATSANFSDDTICFDNNEALARLKDIADVFLVHNRPIVRHMDDSIVRLMYDRPMVLRRARGYAPLGLRGKNVKHNILAMGAHLKNTIALNVQDNIFISQHIGDLETKKSFDTYENICSDLTKLYEVDIREIACDLHPDYLSSKKGLSYNLDISRVQHHHAHVAGCMAENALDGEVLGIAWDGTGYGPDKTVWGGEFLLSTLGDFKRVGAMKTFALPGGDIAVKEPRRVGISLLHEVLGKDILKNKDLGSVKAFAEDEILIIQDMILKDINSPKTSSIGRLFDGIASIIELNQVVHFEGQAAMALEFAIGDENTDEDYDFNIIKNAELYFVDWKSIVEGVIEDLRNIKKAANISAKFHNTLAEIIVSMAKKVGNDRVVMSGGCFQNKYLLERSIPRLKEEGYKPYWHQQVPTNDGGISLGQAVVALNKREK